MGMGNFKKPRHLGEQMTVDGTGSLSSAIAGARVLLGDRANSVPVEIAPGYKKAFQLKFEDLRQQMNKKMKTSNGMDAHKLAALACLSVLVARPIRGEAHAVNEVTAFILAIRIIRNDQIARFCDNPAEHSRVKESLPTFVSPDTINDKQYVSVSLILSLRFLSRALRKMNHLVDVAFLLSSLFFYIDSCSEESVKKVATELGLYHP